MAFVRFVLSLLLGGISGFVTLGVAPIVAGYTPFSPIAITFVMAHLSGALIAILVGPRGPISFN